MHVSFTSFYLTILIICFEFISICVPFFPDQCLFSCGQVSIPASDKPHRSEPWNLNSQGFACTPPMFISALILLIIWWCVHFDQSWFDCMSAELENKGVFLLSFFTKSMFEISVIYGILGPSQEKIASASKHAHVFESRVGYYQCIYIPIWNICTFS